MEAQKTTQQAPTPQAGQAAKKPRKPTVPSVQTFGRKKNSIAVALCKKGRGLLKVNGYPIELIKPEILRFKVFEPILLLGTNVFQGVDIRVRVRGGGYVARIYATRQAIARAIIAYYQKYVDEASKRVLKEKLLAYDRALLVADPRQPEQKQFGGIGSRSRYQKSYR